MKLTFVFSGLDFLRLNQNVCVSLAKILLT